MSYKKLSPAHATRTVKFNDGSTKNQYSRYETGVIAGKYRDMPTLIADETGFDGLGFNSHVGSSDDNWHAINLFDSSHKYVETVAIAGAMDIDHALTLAVTQFDHLGEKGVDYGVLVTNNAEFDGFDGLGWSSDTIGKLMNNPNQDSHYLPIITKKALLAEQSQVTADTVMWDGLSLKSHGGDETRLFLDMQKNDSFGELTAKFDMAQALAGMKIEELGFDALMETNNRLDMMKERIFTAMSKASIDGLSVTNATLTQPFKRQGVANVAMQFDLSDGQAIVIWFHNPDADPKKLAAGDMMVSWKWMLNKRDITAAVSPKNGENVQVPQLAMRMMKVAAKNSKRFAAAQAKKAENAQALADAQKAVDDKTATLAQLDKDIADLNNQIEEASKVVVETPVEPVANTDVSTEIQQNETKPTTALSDIRKNLLGSQTDTVDKLYTENIKMVEGLYEEFQKKSDELKSQLPDVDVLDFKDFIEKGDFSAFLSTKNAKQLYEYLANDLKQAKNDLIDIINDDKKPTDIVGKDTKNPKESAIKYLVRQIASDYASLQDKTQYEKYQENYIAYLKDLIDDKKEPTPTNDQQFNESAALANPLAEKLIKKTIRIPKDMVSGDDPTYFIENGQTVFKAFNIKIIKNSKGGTYAYTEYLGDDGEWWQLKDNAIEAPEFQEINDAARELWESVNSQNSRPIEDNEATELNPEPEKTTLDYVYDELINLGWQRNSEYIKKTFKNVAEAGSLSNGDRILTGYFDEQERYLALQNPMMGDNVKSYIAETNIDMRDYGYNEEGYKNAAKAFDEKVNAYVEGLKAKVVPTVESEPAMEQPLTPEPVVATSPEQAKLDAMLKEQQFMKDVNKIVQSKKLSHEEKVTAIMALGSTKTVAEELATDDGTWHGSAGFKPFQLTNLNNRIKAQKQRVETAKKVDDINSSLGDDGMELAGVTIKLDKDDNRLRLYFPDKPSREIITVLKKSGYKWSPKAQAWQRQLTENAMKSARSVIEQYAEDEGIDMEESNPNAQTSEPIAKNVAEQTTTPNPTVANINEENNVAENTQPSQEQQDIDYLNSIIDGSLVLTESNMKEVITELQRLKKTDIDKDLLRQAVTVYKTFALSVKVGG